MATITNTLPGVWKVEGEYDTIIITAFLTNGEELFAVANTHDYTYMNCETLEKAKEWAEFYADNDEDAEHEDDEIGDGMTDVEADADTLASAGYGTDEDYGCFDSGDY